MSTEINTVVDCARTLRRQGLSSYCGEKCGSCPLGVPEALDEARRQKAAKNFPITNFYGAKFHPVFVSDDNRLLAANLDGQGGPVMITYRDSDEPSTRELANLNMVESSLCGGWG